MKKMKKFLCFVLVFAMTFGCMSGMALAAAGTKPENGVTEGQPFDTGTAGSNMFRIPCLVTLDDGTIVAGCDARWTTYMDGGGLDTIVSYSKDNGATWNYTLANYLGDNGNTHNTASTAFIDPAMATDGETVWMIADLYPAGIALNGANYAPQTGHTGYDANGNLALAKATASVTGASNSSSRASAAFDYHLEKVKGAADNAESYYQLVNSAGTVVEGYTIDAFFNIKGDGIDTNLFCADSPYFPYPTDFLYMTSSKDGGATWSIPTLLDVKEANEQTILVGPGRGMVTSKGRIVFTAYEFTSGDKFSCTIYSDDNGLTWKRGADVSGWSSEAVVTEADGKLYMFTRHGRAYYVSEDWGETWGQQRSTGLTYNDNCQLTAITYSEKIDGKTAILFAAPSSTGSRTNGKIFLGLVQEDTTIDWVKEFSVCDDGAAYAYSCLAELANGDIGLLWEHQSAGIRYDSYTIDEILGLVKNITIDPEEEYVEETAATVAAEITQTPDESVATVTSEYIVEDAVTVLHDHVSNSPSSLTSFNGAAGTNTLDEAEFTFTASGTNWKIYNEEKGVYLTNANQASEFFSETAADMKVEAVGGEFRISKSDATRYIILYYANMDFNSNSGGYKDNYTAGSQELVLLEKQEEASEDDVLPGYKRVSEITSGKNYLITYIWEDGSVIVLYPANGTAAQTKLVGDTVTAAKNVVTITGIAPGETTAVVGDVTYNITVTDPTKSPSYAGLDYPVDKIVATAGSEQAGYASEGPASLALDGNTSTHYHSSWNPKATDDQLWMMFELEEVTALKALRYLPREGATNGSVTKYEILYSVDGTAWKTIAEGNWSLDKAWKLAEFDTAVEVKYIKFVAVDSVADGLGRHMSAAEVRLVTAPEGVVTPPVEEVDRTILETAIAEAKKLIKDNYTAESWAAVEEALADAESVYADEKATQLQVNETAETLNSVVAALQENPLEEETEVFRISGKDRYATGYAAANELKETLGVEKFDAVVVATGKNFADALSGSYLAIVKEAPILLTNGKDENVAELHKYIKENVNANGTVYILGGIAAVPESVEKIETEGYTVNRLAGSTRYETNLDILAEAGIAGTELIVATGKDFADSLSASATGRPILLVKPGAALSAKQKAIAETVKDGNIYVVGGTGAVAETTAAELEAYATVERIAGSGRQETSVKVAETFFKDADTVVVANAKNFPDGLCGGPLAAVMKAPLLLTVNGKTTVVADYLEEKEVKDGFVLGGESALADETIVDVLDVVPKTKEKYKIGIITGTAAQGEEEYLAAMKMKAMYGDKIVTATFPDNYIEEKEQTIATVTDMASDPEVKVIVFVQAVPGAAEAINKVKETRDDILFISGVCAEDPGVIAEESDICMLIDEIAMGTAIIDKAAEMGAKTFVHISFERHLENTVIAARQQLFKDRCAELGIEYVEAEAPDPTGDAGIAGAQEWVTENIKVYTNKYGKDTAFFCTNCGMQEPLIKQVAELGAIFPQQCCPSPYHGYPAAFGISTEGHEGDVPYMLAQIRAKVAEYGNLGRMATWEVPVNMMMIEAGVEYGIKWCEGEITERCDKEALLAEMKEISGEETRVTHYSDETTGELDNFFMILCPFHTF